MAPLEHPLPTRSRALRRLGAAMTAAILLVTGTPDPAPASDPAPATEPRVSGTDHHVDARHPVDAGTSTQLPPPAWLPWQHRVQLDVVTRHAAHTWGLAAAVGQVPGSPAAPGTADGAAASGSMPSSSTAALNPLDYKWPMWPVKLRRAFNPPKKAWGRGHRGVDLEGVPGQPVFAAGPGFISWSGTINSVGSLSVTHTPRLRTTYLPLTGRLPMGTPVIAGTPVGLLAPGHCLPACLHWGAKVSARKYVDPTLLPDFAPELKPRDERRRRR